MKTLAEHGAARTIALAKQMKVTDETVRNDLINLEKRGFLKRVHGGALALTHKSLHEDIVTQDDVSIRIAKKTVQNIPASVVMFIDSSTMGYQICNHINSKDTHVVSNNPTLLTRLEGIPNLSFYCTGGHFDREALVYVGQDAAKAAGSLSIDMVVLTPDCYSPKHGAEGENLPGFFLQRVAVRNDAVGPVAVRAGNDPFQNVHVFQQAAADGIDAEADSVQGRVVVGEDVIAGGCHEENGLEWAFS